MARGLAELDTGLTGEDALAMDRNESAYDDLPADVVELLHNVNLHGGMPASRFEDALEAMGVDPRRVVGRYAKTTGTDVIVSASGQELVSDWRRDTGLMGHPVNRANVRFKVVVTKHAVRRAIARHRLGDSARAQHEIAHEVHEALAAGRLSNHKPRWWSLLHGETRRQLAPGEFFVWDDTQQRAWVVTRSDDAYVVITSLSRG